MQARYLDTLIDRQNHATRLHDSRPLHKVSVGRRESCTCCDCTGFVVAITPDGTHTPIARQSNFF